VRDVELIEPAHRILLRRLRQLARGPRKDSAAARS